MSGQQKLYSKWVKINSDIKLYERCRLLDNLFGICNRAVKDNFSGLIRVKHYDMKGLSALHKYFVLVQKTSK